jgi:hypothetical protein
LNPSNKLDSKTRHEHRLESQRKWRAKNPDKTKQYNARVKTEWARALDIALITERAWRRKQLVAPPLYDPPEHCEACGITFEPTPQHRHCLDHCHVTNRFRGWLCSNCNIALGLAGDNPEGVRRLLEYITRAQAVLDLQLLK